MLYLPFPTTKEAMPETAVIAHPTGVYFIKMFFPASKREFLMSSMTSDRLKLPVTHIKAIIRPPRIKTIKATFNSVLMIPPSVEAEEIPAVAAVVAITILESPYHYFMFDYVLSPDSGDQEKPQNIDIACEADHARGGG